MQECINSFVIGVNSMYLEQPDSIEEELKSDRSDEGSRGLFHSNVSQQFLINASKHVSEILEAVYVTIQCNSSLYQGLEPDKNPASQKDESKSALMSNRDSRWGDAYLEGLKYSYQESQNDLYI